MKITLSIFIFGMFLSFSNTLSKLKLLFSDNMVLQRNSLVDIWGKGTPSQEIKIISDWDEKLILICNLDSSFNSQIKTPEAWDPFSIIVVSESERLKINNIMVGEVWLAFSQSNMRMNLNSYPNKLILNSKNEILNGRSNLPQKAIKRHSKVWIT